MGALVFNTWIKPMKLLKKEEAVLTVSVPNKFFFDWVMENYKPYLDDAVRKALGSAAEVNIVVEEEIKADSSNALVTIADNQPTHSIPTTLNQGYSFERFVVASCNQLAHAAAFSVAEQPARNYNPLFIYSDVGLGKSHLLNAIGIRCSQLHHGLNITYVSAQDFMNEIITAIRQDKMAAFRDKCRHIDFLLVDDVQFIAGKTSTEEEFFHVFNLLHGAGKQIVLTSDKFPKDMANLTERLRSRFQWGLIVDIQHPDVETKMAIIVQKALENACTISNDVAYLISSIPDINIRELEGCLRRVLAYASINKRDLSVELAREALRGVYKTNIKRDVKAEEIVKVVASYYNVKISDVKSSGRKNKNISQARQVSMYLMRKLTNSSFPDIGEKLGGRDHSTVIYGVNKIQMLISKDPVIKGVIKEIEGLLVEGR
ncbi:MAG: chromosomal replication initiator protein DnaA [Deltaproteobacteria bacterium]|nr:chromosomal replication initiator protein DnaA [Deltaproteobacteria bacterium]